MAIYTKANNVPTEAIYVDSCSRITTQEAMFLNPKNVYWGLFEGRFNISSGTIANVVIDNATFRYPLKFEDLSANYMKAVTAVLSDAYINNLSVDSMSSVTFVDLTAYNSHTGSTYSMTFKDVYDNITLSIDTLSTNLSTEIDNLSAALSGEIDALSAKLSSEIDQLSADLSGEIGSLSTSLSNDIKQLSSDLSGEIDSLSTSLSNEIKSLSGALSGEIDSLSIDLSAEISSLAKSLSVEGVLVKNKLSFGYDKDTKQIQFQVYDISGNQYLSSINTRDFADDYVVSCARIENISGDNYLVIYWNNDDPAQVSTAIPLSSLAQTYTGSTGINVSLSNDGDAGISYKISVTDYVATYKQLSDVSTILSNDLSTKIWIENKVDQSKSPGFSDLSIVTLSKEQYAEAMSNKSPYGNMDGSTLYLISSDNLDMFGQKIENLTMTDDNVQSEAVNKNYVDRLSISFNNKITDLSGEIDALSAKLSSEIDQLSADLSGEIDVLSGAFSGEIKQLSTSLSNAISSKVFVGEQTSSVTGDFTDLSVIKISRADYEQAVFDAASNRVDLNNNVLYVISSYYIDAYGQQIKNVVMEDDDFASDAVNKHFVEQLSDKLKLQIDQTNIRIDDLLVSCEIQDLSAHNLTVDNMSVDFNKIVDKDSLSSINDISTSLYSQLSNRCWIGSSISAAPRTNLNVGDVAIVSGYITTDVAASAELSTRTAYYWNGNDWAAMDGNYNARNIYFDNNLSMDGAYTMVGNFDKTKNEAGILSSGVIQSKGKSLQWLFENMFDKEIYPSLGTKPSWSFSLTANTNNTFEVGTVMSAHVNVGYTQGKYNYPWQDPTTIDDGTSFKQMTITDISGNSQIVELTGNNITLSTQYVIADNDSITFTASDVQYNAGIVPKTSKGRDWSTAQRSAGTSDNPASRTVGTIHGSYYCFCGEVAADKDIATLSSSEIRELQKKVWTSDLMSTQISTDIGMKQFVFACPKGKYNSITVKQGDPVISITLKKHQDDFNVKVDGGNGAETKYTLFYQINDDTALNTNTYTVTEVS